MSESDLDQVLSGEQPEVVAEPEAAVEAEVVVEEPAPEVAAAPEPKPEPAPETVPVAVVQELRRELRELKQAAMPRPQTPEFIDPEGMGYMQQQVQQISQNVKLDISEEMARSQHGDEKVDAAFAAFQAKDDPGLNQTVMASRSPWNEVVKWHEQQQVAAEIGGDPAAYRANLEAELRTKIEAEMVTKQAQARAAQVAPSMANVTGTGGGPKTTWTGPTPLGSVIGT